MGYWVVLLSILVSKSYAFGTVTSLGICPSDTGGTGHCYCPEGSVIIGFYNMCYSGLGPMYKPIAYPNINPRYSYCETSNKPIRPYCAKKCDGTTDVYVDHNPLGLPILSYQQGTYKTTTIYAKTKNNSYIEETADIEYAYTNPCIYGDTVGYTGKYGSKGYLVHCIKL